MPSKILFISIPDNSPNPVRVDVGKFDGIRVRSAKISHGCVSSGYGSDMIGVHFGGRIDPDWYVGIVESRSFSDGTVTVTPSYFNPKYVWLPVQSDSKKIDMPIHLFASSTLPRILEITRVNPDGTESTTGLTLWLELDVSNLPPFDTQSFFT